MSCTVGVLRPWRCQVDVKTADKTIQRLQAQSQAKDQELGALNIKVTAPQEREPATADALLFVAVSAVGCRIGACAQVYGRQHHNMHTL